MISLVGKTKKSNAFTLIEILLVVIIFGIVLSLAAPNFSKGYNRLQLNKTADDLLSMSRWAQAMAIGQRRIYALNFSNDRNSYSLERGNAPITNGIEEISFAPVKGALGRMRTIPEAITLKTQEDRIEFYPDGTIDSATIELASNNQKIELSSAQVRGMMTKVDNE